jgi:hypothetical protein
MALDRRAAAVALLAIVAVAVGVPVLVGQLDGSFSIPRNDDWVYSRIAERWYSAGHLDMLGWTPTTLVGHLLWGLPFLAVIGRSITALHWAGAAAGALALVGVFAALRRLGTSTAALLGAAVIAACPCFALLAPTYMTDLTALAAQAWCLALGLAALDAEGRKRTALLAASLALGLLAFATREQGLAAPLAVLAAHGVAEGRATHRLTKAATAAGTFAAAVIAFYAWRHGLPGGSGYGIRRPTRKSVEVAARAGFTLGLFALPLAAAARTGGRRGRFPAAVIAVIGIATLAVAAVRGRSPDLLVGNLLTRTGLLDSDALVGARPEVFPGAIWWAVNALAVIGAAGLAAGATTLAGRTKPRGDPKATAAVTYLVLAAAAVFFGALTRSVFDRYLLPVLFGAALVAALGRAPQLRWTTPATAALALLAVLAAVSVSAGNAFDLARWRAGEQAVHKGNPPNTVDAGYEWVGAHYPGRLAEDRPSRARPPTQWYSQDVFPRATNCVTVSAAPLPRTFLLARIGERSYRSLPWGAEHRLLIYSRVDCSA